MVNCPHNQGATAMSIRSGKHAKYEWLRDFDLVLLSMTGFVVLMITTLDLLGVLDQVLWLKDRIPTITLLMIGSISTYLIIERRSYLDSLKTLEQTIFGSNVLQPLGIRQKLDVMYKDYFEQATEKIDIIALTLENAMNSHGKDPFRRTILNETCEIRILILDPESPLWMFRAKDERTNSGQSSPERAKEMIKRTTQFFEEIRDELDLEKCEGSLTVRKHNRIPYFAYFRADDKMILGLYYSFTFGAKAHTISVAPDSELFNALERHFDELWSCAESKPVIDISYFCSPILKTEVDNEQTNP
jgi:hypothetical protein